MAILDKLYLKIKHTNKLTDIYFYKGILEKKKKKLSKSNVSKTLNWETLSWKTSWLDQFYVKGIHIKDALSGKGSSPLRTLEFILEHH